MKKILASIPIVISLLMPFYAHADITSNLLSWYKFDEGSGSTAIDSGSVGNNGTEVNGPTYVTGKVGPFALSFNNSFNQRVETSNASSYNFTSGGFTVSAWVKASAADSCDTIATTLIPPSYQGWEYAISQGSCSVQPGVPSIYNGSIWVSDNHTVNDNTWHLLTVVFDPTGLGAYKFYDNGALSSTQVTGAPSYGATPLWLAGRNDGGAPQYMLGVMDDVRVYNRTLSAADVAELYLYPPAAVANSNQFKANLLNITTPLKQIFFTTTAGSTWTVPYDWNNASNTIEVIGAGGSGSASQLTHVAGGGGGGYAKTSNVSLIPGSSIAYTIGTGGTPVSASSGNTVQGNSGGDTFFNGSSVSNASVSAHGGNSVTSGSTGGSGVNGSTLFSGGGSSVGGVNAGGGGAAGLNGAGGANSGATGGTGDNGTTAAGANGAEYFGVAGSGGGGTGSATTGTAGGTYGAGGGASDTGASGAGSQGLIVVTYTPTPPLFQVMLGNLFQVN